VDVRLGTKQNDRSHLLIEVKDSGPGISVEERARVFEPFVQLGKHGDAKGTGLGLTITRQFVLMMGGEISLESTLGKGALFRIDLPLTEAKETDIAHVEQTRLSHVVGLVPGQPAYRILIVEDQPDNRILLTNLLQAVGLQIKLAENGEEGLACFKSWQPHLILMDWRMPVMDGEEATRLIRELPSGREVKIVAVTASTFKEQRQIMVAAGVDDFIGKPYRADEIYGCLSMQLGLSFQYEAVDEKNEQRVTLTPEMLSVLPKSLRTELQMALESLDNKQIDLTLKQVAVNDPEIYYKLLHYIQNFDYPPVLQALKAD
jgi:CheY-like chemotaxis protein